jgi:hypothetical protein
MSRNSGYLNEIKEIEREMAAEALRREYDQQAPERAAVGTALAAAQRDLRKRLLTDPRESTDFQYTEYAGQYDNSEAGVVTAAIKSAWQEFLAAYPLTEVQQHQLTMFCGLHGDKPDFSKAEVFSQAWDYLCNRLAQFDPQEPTLSVSVPPEQEPQEPEEPRNPHPLHSRAAERWEREQYENSLTMEIHSNAVFAEACQSIADTSNREFKFSDQQTLFRHFATNSRKYGVMTIASIRRAAIDLYGAEQVGLLPEEQETAELNRVFSQGTARESLEALHIPLVSMGAVPVADWRKN